MMNKTQKKNYVTEMKEFFNSNDSVLITHYQGLTVKQLDELRSEMRKNGIMFKITKNRITKLALADTKCKDLSKLFTGPTAVAFSKDAISQSQKEDDRFVETTLVFLQILHKPTAGIKPTW